MPFCDKIIRSLKANSAYAEIRAAVKFYEKCRRPLGKRTVRLENILQLIFFHKDFFFSQKGKGKIPECSGPARIAGLSYKNICIFLLRFNKTRRRDCLCVKGAAYVSDN